MTRPGEDRLPAAPAPTPWGSEAAEAYVAEHIDRFTPEALTTALEAAGYEPAVAREAIRRGEARHAVAPTRATARRVVLVAYLATFAIFAALLLSGGGSGAIATVVLALTLGLAFVISIPWLRWRRLSALWAMVSVPLILLVVVGGACYSVTLDPPRMV
jgi:hypothetical protein